MRKPLHVPQSGAATSGLLANARDYLRYESGLHRRMLMNPVLDFAALVTGGARGIGRAIALELARAGAAVVVGDLNLVSSEVVAGEIRTLGRKALAVQLDVTDRDSVARCVAKAIECFGCINTLVNNAGIFQGHLGLELDDEGFNHCLDVNLTGMWRLIQALVPHFRAQGGGKIINIASVGGRQGVGFAPAYCASKAGVISLTQSLAILLGPDKINVNAICPGAVSTAMRDTIATLRAHSSEEGTCHRMALPLAGPLAAEDIGRAAVFFASDFARNITGQALNVDCGELMN